MDKTVQKKLDDLFKIYSKNLPNKIIQIETLWNEQQRHFNLIKFQDFHREVHSLSGSAGTYGYSELSKAARQMEIFLKTFLNKALLTSEDQEKITAYLSQLKSTLTLELERPTKIPLFEITPSESAENKCVYIVEQDEDLKKQLHESLKQIGYTPHFIQDLITLQMAVKEKPPIAIIIDTQYLVKTDIPLVLNLQMDQATPIQLFCVLPNAELLPRLDAVRAGCQAFFQKPVDIPQLTQILNYKCSITPEDPYRILVIDDSESLAEYYSLVLNQAGMTTRFITNPIELLKELEAFQPNLLLMDVYMPECTGFELAAVLRQESRYTKIPIIFLSTEEDNDTKLFAINLGGDDFLTKPISAQHLISAVRARSKRARILNYYMTTDSLTGLLNHSSILQKLDIQLTRAQFSNEFLSFIMIDIDHFKKINDSYGHVVGDEVLKKLSTLFLSQLRSQDSVGRYGGEEFALILPGSNLKDSQKIVDNLREQFSQYHFRANNTDFFVTFSAGISCFDSTKNTTNMIKNADQALYQAKQLGRNRVVLFNQKKYPPPFN